MFARKDVTHSASALQSDVPDPTILLRGREGMRDDSALRVVIRHLYGQRAINKQHIAAVDKRHSEAPAQQQRAESRSIDKEIRGQLPGLEGVHVLDIARVGFDDLGHVVNNVPDSQVLDTVLADEGSEAA